ncbi:nucleoside-diphosphate-sugar epimerase [Sphingomonas kyeonggiensis]|uniref:NAD-dependent epimerase/dehydratase family protein n=1 Tax=Sphingomonas kyeonggiensis TaxID=1268553 RepID=UPI00277F3BEE|nr:NAD(P)-dependent oxidoreductase [Sphingomonas kyeonggiensis]MDQ0252447.1 nucleoside-diphosphate-sugar epimerase [Sphingomonas kyeonggiensis]
MTILITGSTGLVGSRLLQRLLEAGYDCRAMVRGGRPKPAGAHAVEGDLFDTESLARAVEGVTAIIHLAAVFRTGDEALIWKSNFDGARNLMAAASAHAPHARFILASTSNVYDKSQARPGCESDAVAPTQAYPASKVAAERALCESGLTWTVVRFPFVYGDGDGHLEELPAHLLSANWHPAMRMSTIHHRDIATAMALALDGKFDGHVVNIADDVPASMLDLIALSRGEMTASARPLAEPWAMQVDTALARSLGFRPTVRTVFHAAEQQLL